VAGIQDGDTTLISNAQTTGNPNNVSFATQNWNPGGSGGTYNNVQTGSGALAQGRRVQREPGHRSAECGVQC
jgi:hypothetical protein